jgi:hypothetical protein
VVLQCYLRRPDVAVHRAAIVALGCYLDALATLGSLAGFDLEADGDLDAVPSHDDAREAWGRWSSTQARQAVQRAGLALDEHNLGTRVAVQVGYATDALIAAGHYALRAIRRGCGEVC